MTNPRNMSDNDFMALPIGPDAIVDMTEADIAAGMNGRTKLVRRRTLAKAYGGDDMLFRVINGDTWTVGQWEDETWFRQPFSLM